MRQTQRSTAQINSRRHSRNTKGLSFSQFATALGVGMVLILLGATFIGDFLRVPKLTAAAFPTTISPNGDQTQDTTSLSYSISEASDVTIEVLSESGLPIKTLSSQKSLPAGQYVVQWNGTDNTDQIVADGRYRLKVSAAGPSRSSVQEVDILVDTAPPTLRLTNLEDITRVADPALTIEGLTDIGATVYQAGNAQPVSVNNQGRFTIERQLTEGVTILEIFATDKAGNTTTTSHEVTLVTAPPELTIITPLNDQWLGDAIVDINGLAPGAASLKVNGQPVNLLQDGAFNHELILQEGNNVIRVEATDDVGNVTVQERLVHIKTAPPALSLSVDEGAKFQQSAIQLTGRTDPGATVLVNDQVVTVSPVGEFQAAINLVNGNNTISVEARDIAGNVATLSRHVQFESPVAENELTRLMNNFPAVSSLGTPLLILLPTLLLLGYMFTRPVSLMLSADSDSFTPGLPDEGKVISLTLDLSKSARTTVEVLNQFKRPVVTITGRRQREAGQHTFYWDGYDNTGHVVNPGEYILQATASASSGTVSATVPIYIHEDPLVHGQYGHSRYNRPLSQPEQVQVGNRRRGR